MLPIYLCTKAQSPEDFFGEFKKECMLCLKNNETLTTAFLAYDFDNPEIVNVLLDPVYWNAINQATKKRIALFYINPTDLIKKNTKKLYNQVRTSKGIERYFQYLNLNE